ncbi:MAG TPA: TolC family protein [Flavobacteriaceae bacterium]|nr:TolC family protein [Flavobacteriaceae bacterium]
MKTYSYILFLFLSFSAFSQEVLTLEECYNLAEKNYPLARQIELLEDKSRNQIGIISKGRLPQLDINAQASYQSEVIQFPLELPNITIDPPNKDQYRVSLDANQLIYYGGSIEANTKLKEAELKSQQQKVAVNLYALRSRINQSYFSVLLFQEQIKLQTSKMEELEVRLKEIDSGVKYGAILPSAKQSLQAEKLKLEQQLSESNFNRKKAIESLSALIAQNLDSNTVLERMPANITLDAEAERPEMKLFELQEKQLVSSQDVLSKTKYPRLMGFAQFGYGNPGLNMLDNSFQDFYMVGLKIKWNILDWGKVKEQKQIIDISKNILATEKETFILNNSIQLQDAQSDINKFEEILQKDEEIIHLREQVLDAATSQFQNGVIPSSEYITELNNLYEAKIAQELHQTQLSLAKANFNLIKGNRK